MDGLPNILRNARASSWTTPHCVTRFPVNEPPDKLPPDFTLLNKDAKSGAKMAICELSGRELSGPLERLWTAEHAAMKGASDIGGLASICIDVSGARSVSETDHMAVLSLSDAGCAIYGSPEC